MKSMTTEESRIVNWLCPSLRAVCEMEIARGNRVCEVWEGDWPRPDSVFVLLENPFARRYDEFTDLEFSQLNDPHYWGDDYSVKNGRLILACKFQPR